MHLFFKKLQTSIQHLQIIDKIFTNFDHSQKEVYLNFSKVIDEIDEKWRNKGVSFSEQLYVGGKKKGKYGYARQMILADIVEYIFTGRGYYFFLGHKNDPDRDEKISDFMKILLTCINQLMIWDSISVEKDLRYKVLSELEEKIDNSIFFKEQERKDEHDKLLRITEDIGFETSIENFLSINESATVKKSMDEYFDSLLPKTGGGLWNELIVYINLLKANVGYILPLLLTQRIYSLKDTLKPPDFIVIDYDGNMNSIRIADSEIISNLHEQKLIGVEVGGGKEFQSSTFSGKTKQPATTTENKNIPPRCPLCGKWILFCKKVINDFCDIKNPLTYRKKHIKCLYQCHYYEPNDIKNGSCPDVQYFGAVDKNSEASFKIRAKYSKYHYHHSCITNLNDPIVSHYLDKTWNQYIAAIGRENDRFSINTKTKSTGIVSNYPYISGVEALEMYYNKSKMFCYGKRDEVKDKRNCLNKYCKFSVECYEFTEFRKHLNLNS